MDGKGLLVFALTSRTPREVQELRCRECRAAEEVRRAFLVRAGAFENPEGSSRARNVIIEFPSYEAALECYRSPEYQEAIKHRIGASTIDMLLIEGYDGPQLT